MATTEAVPSRAGSPGCAFLTRDSHPDILFTAEDLTAEHPATARAADQFFAREAEPRPDAGTNEINRLVVAATHLKRAAPGLNDLLSAAAEAVNEIRRGIASSGCRIVQRAHRALLPRPGIAHQRYGAAPGRNQQATMRIADMMMELPAVESTSLRVACPNRGANAQDVAAIYAREGILRIGDAARDVLGARSEPGRPPEDFSALRQLTDVLPADAAALRDRMAERLPARESYAV